MKLITNAAEALENTSGTVKITTSVKHLSRSGFQENILEKTPEPGEYISLEITDDGIGMNQETMERLFDPFFTTKFTGRGLGMSAVKGIVEGHSGAIFVDSQLNTGTTIQILLPRSDTPEDIAKENSTEQKSSEEILKSVSGKMLLVEDEEMVRNVCTSMMENLGIDVIQAPDGKSAVRIYRENPSDISCALVDYRMPGMDGVETFKQLLRIDSDIRIILSSGFTEDAQFRELRNQGLAGFLHKPYEFNNLRDTLARILGE